MVRSRHPVRETANRPPSAQRRTNGFTLLELIVAVALIAAIAAIAIPAYRGHVAASRDSVIVNAMTSMAVFQEDLRLRTGAYGGGVYDANAGNRTLTDAIGWAPRTDDGTTYVVVANGGVSWRATVTTATGKRLCRVFPERTPCS